VLFELFVDVEQQLFDLLASHCVLQVKARANAQMEWLLGLLLLGPLLEAGALAPESQLHDLADLWHVFLALRDDALHVAALGSDQATGHLELTFVRNLDIVAARILYGSIRARSRTLLHGVALHGLSRRLEGSTVRKQASCCASSRYEVLGACLQQVRKRVIVYVLLLELGRGCQQRTLYCEGVVKGRVCSQLVAND